MLRLTRRDMEAWGIPRPDPANPYDLVIREITNRVASTFRAQRDIDITTSCAIGGLDDPSVNARCFRSREGHYAIVLHHGLMNLLHKHSKLLTAAVNPGWIVYSSRGDHAKLASETLVSWADELGAIYRRTGETKGAIVKLEREGSQIASTMLILSEAFVVGHEVGHFLAGHLEDQSRLARDSGNPSLEFYAENSSFQQEFEADGYGFEAMCDHFEAEMPKPILLGALVSTFEVLRLIGAGAASCTHPSGPERVHVVVEGHFSSATARLVHRWIDEGDREAAAEALRTAH